MPAPKFNEFSRSDLAEDTNGGAVIRGRVARFSSSDADAIMAAHVHVQQAMKKVLDETRPQWGSVLIDMVVLERGVHEVITDMHLHGQKGFKEGPVQYWVRCQYVAHFRPMDKKYG